MSSTPKTISPNALPLQTKVRLHSRFARDGRVQHVSPMFAGRTARIMGYLPLESSYTGLQAYVIRIGDQIGYADETQFEVVR